MRRLKCVAYLQSSGQIKYLFIRKEKVVIEEQQLGLGADLMGQVGKRRLLRWGKGAITII